MMGREDLLDGVADTLDHLDQARLILGDGFARRLLAAKEWASIAVTIARQITLEAVRCTGHK
jgi:hypothetical protein